MAFRIETRLITPGFARELLARNIDNNRNVRPTRVNQYARDIAAGSWPITGDTIKVDTANRLLDGQHRLHAVIQADTAVEMLIAWDVDPAVMPLLDMNATRSFADVLKVSGAPHRIAAAAIVRRVLMWENGNRMAGSGQGATQPTHAELTMRHEKDPLGFDAAAARGDDVRRMKLSVVSVAGTCFYLFTQIDQEQCHQFFDALMTGANLHEGHPILTLRNRLISKSERLTTAEVQALYIRAWNAWREGRSLTTVPVTTGGRKLTNANYPIPK